MATFSPIEIIPGSDTQTAFNAINENFRQLASANRTDIIRDESGDTRIFIGKFPDGTYGMAISKKGIDCLTALEK